jgi:hypothetical protein
VATARSDELRALAQQVADALPPEAVEIVLTGSVSRGVADEVSDVEMLVVTEELPSLEAASVASRAAGLTKLGSWGPQDTPSRRVSGYVDGVPFELVWWTRAHTGEHLDSAGDALLHGVPLRTSGLLAGWQERLRDFSDELAAERIEDAALTWGGFAPEAMLTVTRQGERLPLAGRLVDDATRIVRIVFALNRRPVPTTKRLALRLEPLTVKPARVAERIEAALADPEPRRALRTMAELQAETLALAPPGPNVDRARAWVADVLEVLA